MMNWSSLCIIVSSNSCRWNCSTKEQDVNIYCYSAFFKNGFNGFDLMLTFSAKPNGGGGKVSTLEDAA